MRRRDTALPVRAAQKRWTASPSPTPGTTPACHQPRKLAWRTVTAQPQQQRESTKGPWRAEPWQPPYLMIPPMLG